MPAASEGSGGLVRQQGGLVALRVLKWVLLPAVGGLGTSEVRATVPPWPRAPQLVAPTAPGRWPCWRRCPSSWAAGCPQRSFLLSPQTAGPGDSSTRSHTTSEAGGLWTSATGRTSPPGEPGPGGCEGAALLGHWEPPQLPGGPARPQSRCQADGAGMSRGLRRPWPCVLRELGSCDPDFR